MSTKYIKYKRRKNKDGTFELQMVCKKCGQPIDHATDIGPLCKNECALRDLQIKKRTTLCSLLFR